MDWHSINFGLEHPDYNFRLMSYIPSDVLSRLPLEDFQIDRYADLLNWDIMSSKELPGWIFVKYKNRINWEVFLQNKHPKEINFLLDVRDKLHENAHLFFDTRIKKLYYTEHFISAFPEYIDWNWCARYIKLSDYIIFRNWTKFNINILSKYQTFSDEIIQQKRTSIAWEYASKKPISPNILKEVAMMRWDIMIQYQTFDVQFIQSQFEQFEYSKTAVYALCRYQPLTEAFILTKHKKLLMSIISEFQNLTIDFIKANQSILSMESLAKNNNYNKSDSIQILQSGERWYIIDTPIIQVPNTKIHYCYEFTDIQNI